ncbi:MAG: RluA family pseudouridine synthase [Bacteroidales bacterium]|nr:RluA family pseudouridine synthase [Bacteroidales bacterium]
MNRFTYPFCYTPDPEIVDAADRLIHRIDADPELRNLFREGKMMGVLMVEDAEGRKDFMYAFSGIAGGKGVVEGFVPPIFDLTDPGGYFRKKEAEISELNRLISNSGDASEIEAMKARRKEMSVALQEWLFRQYVVLNALGERKTILDIFAERDLMPPGGTGDCAAPKLLQYAYLHGLKPLAMGEFWYGESPEKEVRRQGCFYPSCTGKCGPLLAFMLQGLDVEPNPLEEDSPSSSEDFSIVYEDGDIIVADKPSGMLAVPGRTLKVSLQERLQRLAGPGTDIRACHRLDMDTSGLIVFAMGTGNLAVLQQQFERHEVQKSYVAKLCPGKPLAAAGRISLPLMLDYDDRPRQMVDFKDGKQAVTDWELLRELPGGEALVRFTPLTGRTHQLRVHAAHPLGLGRPIAGDRLYGGGSGRLCLHAATLSFTHPRTAQPLSFTSDPRF